MQSRRGRSPARPESMPPGYLQGALATPFSTMPYATNFAPPPSASVYSCLNPPEQPTMSGHNNDDDVHSASPAPSPGFPTTPMPSFIPPPGLSFARLQSLNLPADLPQSFGPPGRVSRPLIPNVVSNVPAIVPKNGGHLGLAAAYSGRPMPTILQPCQPGAPGTCLYTERSGPDRGWTCGMPCS